MHISICCIYILGYNNGQMEPTCEMKFQLQVSREDMLAIELFVTGTDGINASSSYIIIHLIYICMYSQMMEEDCMHYKVCNEVHIGQIATRWS